MKVEHFNTQKAAMRYAHHYMLRGRQVQVVRKKRIWFVRVFAGGQR